MRIGLITEKVGMTQSFTEVGVQVPVTVLRVERCMVLEQKTKEVDQYTAVKVCAREAPVNKISKPLRGYYAKKGAEPCKILKEFRVTEDCLVDVGKKVGADHFVAGQLVDVTGISKGKGFAGAMKRYGFSGLRATHGVSVSHRSHGSTGNRTKPGRVFKNKRMAGHMGNRKVTTLNLTLYDVDVERDLLFVKGCVPGPKGSLIFVRDAVKAGKAKG
jgi:large subunit ribosomal protein L3